MTMLYCVSEIPNRYRFNFYATVTVAVDESVYFLGYNATRPVGIQVLAFQPKSRSWEVVQPHSSEGGSKDHPTTLFVDEELFTESHDQKIYICAGEAEIHIFNTRNLRWSTVAATGDKPSGYIIWVCTCLHDGHIYVCAKNGEDVDGFPPLFLRVWSLELTHMHWKLEGSCDWGEAYFPRRVVPFRNLLYVLLDMFDRTESSPYAIGNFDLSTRTWELLEPSGTKPLSKWVPFVYRQTLYVLLERRIDCNIAAIGNLKPNEVFRYSFSENKWEQVWFRGITAPDVVDRVWVVNDATLFFSSKKQIMYVLDFFPSLRSMCLNAVCRHKLDTNCLPAMLKRELSMYSYNSE